MENDKSHRIFAFTIIETDLNNYFMANSLLNAMRTKDRLTENGMATNSTSSNSCVDLFFQIGAMRGQDKQRLINSFVKAWSENPLTAMRLLFWARDIRGGSGERQIFRDLVRYLADKHTDSLAKNLYLFSEYGRWDDLLVLIGTKLETKALDTIKAGLEAKNGLCAKWMPRPNVSNRESKRQAKVLAKHLKLNIGNYRKLIVGLSKTVEQLMCAKNWNAIDYSKLPSKAMSDYMKAFSKNDLARFQVYLESVKKGETKINAGALFPYNIINNLRNGSKDGADVQWNALPNFLVDNTERFIPIVDVSNSMTWAAISGSIYPIDVAVSLGLYISERNVGPFKDAFITFSTTPELNVLKGSLSERYNQMLHSNFHGSTNIQAVFELILHKAKQGKVPSSEMPTMVLIMSDMEFDGGTSTGYNRGRTTNQTAQELIEDMYAAAGYEVPKVVYWNLQARNDNNPVKFDKSGTALISGFNPALLKNLLAGKDLSPVNMMNQVVNSERYAAVTI